MKAQYDINDVRQRWSLFLSEPTLEMNTLYVAGGCFWCIEAVFQKVRGVKRVVSGYVGGAADTAHYRAVCSGQTGHAEAVCIEFDSSSIGVLPLLHIFFTVAHDPTQLNRQGHDVGSQYRSALFYETTTQKQYFERWCSFIDESGVFAQKIATSIEPMGGFYVAEEEHQNFAVCHPFHPYIRGVAVPKLDALTHGFSDYLKEM